jgi:hypothetical protein
MPPRHAYLTLPTSALDRILQEAGSAGIDPLWLLAAMAVEVRDRHADEASPAGRLAS